MTYTLIYIYILIHFDSINTFQICYMPGPATGAKVIQSLLMCSSALAATVGRGERSRCVIGKGGISSMEEVGGLGRMRDRLGAKRRAQGRGGVLRRDKERRRDAEEWVG